MAEARAAITAISGRPDVRDALARGDWSVALQRFSTRVAPDRDCRAYRAFAVPGFKAGWRDRVMHQVSRH